MTKTDAIVPVDGTEDWHGTLYGYISMFCRCQFCAEWWAAYQAELREERHAKLVTGQLHDLEHGTISTYSNYKCRCGDCKTAYRVYQRDYRARRKARLGQL